jgi:Domain of unknown function (DUF4382)
VEPLARHVRLAALILALAALGACSGSLDINLTDTPVDNASSVIVDFTGIELHDTNGKTVTITFPSAQPIDLLQLQNGTLGALLQGEAVPAGTYDWLQLNVLANKDTQGQSYITLDTGAQYPLYIPSGSQTALRILSPFTVTEGRTTQLLIELDLRQSITSSAADGQNYAFVPALRLENQADLGAISAVIDLAALASAQLGAGTQVSQCEGGLFLFSGAAVTPQNGGGASLVDFEPIPSGGLTSTQVAISLANLTPGSYTLAATCDYNLYQPTALPGQSGYQALHWTVQGSVAVTMNATVTSSLPSPTTSNIVK